MFVENTAQARACLEHRFAEPDAPCFARAVATCDSCLSGKLQGAAARAALVVAAMEAGCPFELIDDPVQALEGVGGRRVEMTAQRGIGRRHRSIDVDPAVRFQAH